MDDLITASAIIFTSGRSLIASMESIVNVKFTKMVRIVSSEFSTNFGVNKNHPEDLPSYILRVMAEEKIGLREVARRAEEANQEITHSYISRLISGAAQNPTADKIKALAKGLGRDEQEVWAVVSGTAIDEEKLRQSAQAALFFEIEGLPEADRQARIDPLIDSLRDAVKKLKKEKKL